MKTLLKIHFVFLFVFVSALSVFGQSDAQIEKELVAALKDIQTFSIYGGGYDEGKLSKAQKVFEEKLLLYTKTASTLNYEFSELGKLMSIARSEDGKFRIYSWDLQDGGTMRRFARIYQYRGAKEKVLSKADEVQVEGMGRGFVTDIFALDTKDGTVYIVCSTIIGSTKDYFQSAGLYKIEGSALNNNVKLIKTTSGLTNTLGFEYDNFSVIDRKERPIKLITYDNETNTLKIPVVIKDKEFPDGRITDKFISYRFNGKYFVRVS
jgi:hypothetical protein